MENERNIWMDRLRLCVTRMARKNISNQLLVGLFIFVACLQACSATSEKNSATAKPAASDPLPNTVTRPDIITKSPARERTLALTDLSVREDRGQTVLFVKLSQPVSDFRHFPLPN